jgi:hypothetical protein
VRIRRGILALAALLLAPFIFVMTFVVGLAAMEQVLRAMPHTQIRPGRLRRFRHYRRGR